MARPFVAPDPKDRSANSPSIIMSPIQVLGLYNQENEEKKEKVVESVRDWYARRMKDIGWQKVEFHGNQCVLTAMVKVGK